MKNIPEWLYLWTTKALLGEIYPSIRAIAVGFNEERCLVLRYYLDREPKEDDYENIDEVITNILANTSSNNDIRDVKDEIHFNLKPFKDLEPLNGFIYMRKER
ncbi:MULTISPECIES: hypothetical protein [unclassified Cedecea]|uniref:hypothetical protein n=1 Tax=unclassified Cedecea TaxID=2649846 RepID=UPI003018F092